MHKLLASYLKTSDGRDAQPWEIAALQHLTAGARDVGDVGELHFVLKTARNIAQWRRPPRALQLARPPLRMLEGGRR